MTKDEAWKAHVEEYDRDRFDSTSRHRRHCFDAGWDAALSDTLGLMETVRHYLTETPRYVVRSGRNSEYIGQDEIVAAIDTVLLAGKEEKE